MSHEISDVLTNVALPKTQATITLRVIKSFEYRTERSLVLHMLNLEITTVGELKDMARRAIQTSSGWKPYRNVHLDTLKLYTKAHGAKTTNLIINMDHDDWIFDDDARTLAELGIENETEISFFNRVAYNAFKENPEVPPPLILMKSSFSVPSNSGSMGHSSVMRRANQEVKKC